MIDAVTSTQLATDIQNLGTQRALSKLTCKLTPDVNLSVDAIPNPSWVGPTDEALICTAVTTKPISTACRTAAAIVADASDVLRALNSSGPGRATASSMWWL